MAVDGRVQALHDTRGAVATSQGPCMLCQHSHRFAYVLFGLPGQSVAHAVGLDRDLLGHQRQWLVGSQSREDAMPLDQHIVPIVDQL